MNEEALEVKKEYVPTIGGAVKLLLMYLVVMLIPSILLGVICAILQVPVDPLTQGLTSGIGLALLILWIRRKHAITLTPLFSERGTARAHYLPMVLVVCGLSIILSEADNVLRSFWPMTGFWQEALGSLTSGETGLWKSFLAVAIIAPVVEEILFRGIILRGFMHHYSANKSIVMSALLFGLFHLNPWQFFPAFVFGLLAAWWFVQTGSLVMCIFIHALNNSLSFILRSLRIHIPGFTGNGGSLPEFQPLWFNVLGIVMLAAGIAVLYTMFKRRESQTATTDQSQGILPLGKL